MFRHAVVRVLCDTALRTMSGGDPSSIKRLLLCAAVNLYDRVTERIRRFVLMRAAVRSRVREVDGLPEAYQALYRKYRPVTFDDVIGQRHITDVLRSEVTGGRIAHAYLFTGSRGTTI